MAPSQTPEPNPQAVVHLRETVLQTLQEKGVFDSLDARDIKRFKSDDVYVGRFLRNHDNEHKLAHEMAVDTLQWRKTFGTNDITERDCDQKYLEKGILCLYNKDRDGCPLLLFTVRNHTRGSVDFEILKKTLIYFIERFEREGGVKMTVFFDMQDTGLKNMDMDFIQYMVNVFKFYYPFILNYILVFEMPWILNAMWKIIKTWLPPKSLEIIKFIDKKGIPTYIAPDQALMTWGGNHEFTYTFSPEKKGGPSASATAALVNGDIENKKVHFAESRSKSQAPKLKISSKPGSSISGAVCLDLSPSDELMFSSNKVGSTVSMTLTSQSAALIAYKIKTTSPDKYRVKPSLGVLEPQTKTEIVITLLDQQAPSALVRDKFLVVGIPVAEGSTSDGVDQDFKLASKEDTLELRIRVGMTAPESPTMENTANHVQSTLAPPPVSPMLLNKIDQLLIRQAHLEEQFVSARRLMFLTLLLMVGILCVLVFTTVNLSSSIVASNNAMMYGERGSLYNRPKIDL